MRVIINWLERKKEIIVIVLLCTLIWIVCGVTDIWFWGQNKIPSFIPVFSILSCTDAIISLIV